MFRYAGRSAGGNSGVSVGRHVRKSACCSVDMSYIRYSSMPVGRYLVNSAFQCARRLAQYVGTSVYPSVAISENRLIVQSIDWLRRKNRYAAGRSLCRSVGPPFSEWREKLGVFFVGGDVQQLSLRQVIQSCVDHGLRAHAHRYITHPTNKSTKHREKGRGGRDK